MRLSDAVLSNHPLGDVRSRQTERLGNTTGEFNLSLEIVIPGKKQPSFALLLKSQSQGNRVTEGEEEDRSALKIPRAGTSRTFLNALVATEVKRNLRTDEYCDVCHVT